MKKTTPPVDRQTDRQQHVHLYQLPIPRDIAETAATTTTTTQQQQLIEDDVAISATTHTCIF